jgi:hypothetical protein
MYNANSSCWARASHCILRVMNAGTTKQDDDEPRPPTEEELAACDKVQVWNKADGCWIWRNPLRRRWTRRPDCFALDRAARKTFGLYESAKRANVSPQTMVKATSNPPDPSLAYGSINSLAMAGPAYAESLEEMSE